MSSILLLLEDGEMHPFVPGSSAGGQIILTRGDGSGDPGDEHESLAYTDAVITSAGNEDALTLGSHFLTSDGIATGIKDEDPPGTVVTKLEVENVPVEVVVEKSGKRKGKKGAKGHGATGVILSNDPNSEVSERKVCLWPTGNGTTCGKTFTKFDSLKRHLSEAHKGLRPFACSLCDKTYGRRDYLHRHLKSHNNSYAVNLAGATNAASGSVKKQNVGSGNIVLVQQPQSISGGAVQIIQTAPTTTTKSQMSLGSPNANADPQTPLNQPNPLPFLHLNGQLPTAKPMGSKICRWVQNDGTVCGKAFSKLDSLRRHVNELHKGVRPYACNLCDKSYGRRDYLDRHMRTHEKKANKAAAAASVTDGSIDWGPNSGVLLSGDEIPPPPKIPKKKRKDIPPEEKKICLWVMDDGNACGKTFTKFDSLKRHVSESHKSIRPYACSLCGKSYGRRDYLLRHLKSHNDIEVSNITIQKIPNNPSNHPANQTSLNTSTGSSGGSGGNASTALPSINFSQMVPQPPAALSGIITSPNPPVRVAGATGTSAKKKAMEEKKTCKWVLENGTVCGKTFSKFDSLRRHVAELHKNIRPYVCALCNKTYGRKDYLDRHMRSHLVEGMKMEEGSESDLLNDSSDIMHGNSVTIDADDIETTTTTVVVDTGDPHEDEVLPNVVTVVRNDDV